MRPGATAFWLARWLRERGEAYVIHPTSVAVSREHRRAKTDRLDTALLKRVFLGWLRGEPKHCSMVAIPTLAEEDGQASQPRAREPGGRAHAACQPHQAAWSAWAFEPSSRRRPGASTGATGPRREGMSSLALVIVLDLIACVLIAAGLASRIPVFHLRRKRARICRFCRVSTMALEPSLSYRK